DHILDFGLEFEQTIEIEREPCGDSAEIGRLPARRLEMRRGRPRAGPAAQLHKPGDVVDGARHEARLAQTLPGIFGKGPRNTTVRGPEPDDVVERGGQAQ